MTSLFHYDMCQNKNWSIRKALLIKAASYYDNESYKSDAYRKAAISINSLDMDLFDEYSKGTLFSTKVKGIGKSIESYIRQFIKNPPPSSICTIPHNEAIYRALMDKANTYCHEDDVIYGEEEYYYDCEVKYPSDKLRFLAFKGAALNVAYCERNIYLEYAYCGYCGNFTDDNEVEEFLYDFLAGNKTECLNSKNQYVYSSLIARVNAFTFDMDIEASMFRMAAEYVASTSIDVLHYTYKSDWLNHLPVEIRAFIYKAFIGNEENLHPYNVEAKVINKYEIIEGIQKACDILDLPYTVDLLDEYMMWIPENSTKDYIENIIHWSKHISNILGKQIKDREINKYIIKYCKENGIKYNLYMFKECSDWIHSLDKEDYTYNLVNEWFSGFDK